MEFNRGGFYELFGKRVDRLSISVGEQDLVFWTNEGPLVFSTDADCCSETWFADITGVNALLGNVVTDIEMLDLPGPNDNRSRQEVDSQYGVKLVTPAGHTDIVYRNSSNGYYGGSVLEPTQDPPHPGVLRDIKDDWHA